MAQDRREDILARLVQICAATFGTDKAFRNQTEIPEDKRPGAVVLDGDETRWVPGENADNRRPVRGPVMVTMGPQIVILAADLTENVGPALNTHRAALLKAVTGDQTLADMCHEIRYEGLTSSLALGRTMEGQVALHFSFTYHLRIDQL
jgi:hypothetical protein